MNLYESIEKNLKESEHSDDYCTIAATEFVVDRLPSDWKNLSNDELKELVREEVNNYNNANVEPEYENEDFYGDEADYNKVFDYIIYSYK